MLNRVATWRANETSRSISPDVAAAIDAFLTELNKNPDRDVGDGRNALSKAYYAFCEVDKQHS